MRHPVAVELLNSALAAIADEMGITHVRASYSSIVRDMLDFSTAVTDARGRIVAQGLSLALQLGAIPRFMSNLAASHPQLRSGDVFLLNHPWQGGVHLPDFFFARPVFAVDDDRVPVAFAVIVSHMVDVGGPFPGSMSPSATSLWEEGLVIPQVKLVDAGTLNTAVMDVIAANSRAPTQVRGDLRAVLAGLEAGSRQITALASRIGAQAMRDDMQELLQRTRHATRAAIRRLPDGTGTAEDWLDDDGLHGAPIRFCCTVTKLDDRLRFDFTGTSPQLASGLNTTEVDVISVVAFVTRAAAGEALDVNGGFYDCLEYVAPEGSMINARYPAAVSARAAAIYRMKDVAMAALAQVAPSRVMATDGGPVMLAFSGARPTGADWIFIDYIHSGWGERRGALVPPECLIPCPTRRIFRPRSSSRSTR